MYLDVLVTVIIVVLLIILILNVFMFMSYKQDMDYVSERIATRASMEGRFLYTDEDDFINSICQEIGFDVSSLEVTYTSPDYFTHNDKVQYGDQMKVSIKYTVELLGGFGPPIELTSSYSGLSQVYWK